MSCVGSKLWRFLHNNVHNPSQYEAWLANFKRLMKQDCVQHWSKITQDHPPDFSSAEAFYRWKIDRHNDVNRKLKKPVFKI